MSNIFKKFWTRKHLVVTFPANMQDELMEISKYINSDDFKAVRIKIDPDGLIPPKYYGTMQGYMLTCFAALKSVK